jgi:poly-beta-1,6-N-acetyl-D-glucosamine synthase
MRRMDRKYVLISPCRDEATYMRSTLDSVTTQTVPPTLWVIVDDGSTDNSAAIVDEYARRCDFIRLVRRENRGHRSVGPGVVEAFYAGLESIRLEDYAFVGKLDLDLDLPRTYFETLLHRFEADPWLGAFSGKVYLRLEDGRLEPERMGDENAIGAAKFYRVRCFKDIGGFVWMLGWDIVDGHLCRRNDWITGSSDDPSLRIVHLRRMGTSQTSLWSGRMRWGSSKWAMGSAWYFVLAVSLYRIFQKPYVLGGVGILSGYARSMLRREPRYGDREFRRFLHRYETRSLLTGKRRALASCNRAIRERRASQGDPGENGVGAR